MGSLDPEIQQLAARLAPALAPLISEQLISRGDWTPSFGGSSTNGTITTYSFQVGRYIRVGPLVVARFSMLIGAITVAPTGNLLIRGLPFVSRNSLNDFQPGCFAQYNGLNLTAGAIDVAPRMIAGVDYIEFVESYDNAGATLIGAAALSAGAAAIGCIIYETE